ncbi:hypothetical protein KDW54_06740 [Burkholderia ambifaria]|uniref:hypothetical protein n=1 Tax=Burkholderia ambifaria TaxID=152480 RepID=UPI001B92741B|nr:hypothetical protein [Burkholderia ambifaria]MBR8182095.1 hypothetical protein [Burkholderia ambifaria]
MADEYDVMDVLASMSAQALYPNGTGQASIAGAPVICYAGWPTASRLDADLKVGKIHVTVYARPEEKNTTRYMTQTQSVPATTPTLTLGAAGQAVTVGGAMPSPFTAHNLAVFVNGKPYLYAVQSGDSLTSIATALAASIAADVPGTTSSGAVIAVATGAKVGALRVGTSGVGIREVGRQERRFQITVWADTPDHRKAVVRPIKALLADSHFITLPDGTAGRLVYVGGGGPNDNPQDAKLYRHDLFYSCEYGTTVADPQYQIVAIETNLSADGSTQPRVTTTYQ